MPNGGSRCSSNQVFWESRKLSRIVRHPNQVLAESVILSRIVRHPNQVLAESVMLSRLVMHSNQIILGPMSTNRLCSNNSDEFVRQHFLCRASIRCSLWKSKDGNISSLPFSLLQRIQKRVSIEMCNNHQTKHGELEIAKTKCITVVMIMVIFVANVGGFPNSALAFNWFGQPNEEKDPVEPFTLYGSIFKKYLIEDLVEGKIVGRRKGFTASACVNALDASKESPELQGMPAGLKVMVIGKPCCAKGEGQTREGACMTPCTHACQAAVLRHVAEVKEETGYILDSSDTTKVTSACSTQCFNECTKPGKSISFVFPFRPH